MADIFLSYSRADKPLAEPLVAALEAQGWSVWWDMHLAPGADFDRVTGDALKTARAVVVLWTPTSVASRWVRGEARVGADRGVLIPVRFENAELPIDVRAIHTTDLDGWGGDPGNAAFGTLAQSLADLLGRADRPAPPRTPPRPGHARKPALIAAAAIAAVLALAGAGFAAWKLLAPPPRAATVTLADFKAVGAGVPPDLAATFTETVRDAFGQDNDLVVKSRGGDYVLQGAIQRAGDKLRYSVRLERAHDGAVVWAASPEYPDADPHRALRTAVDVSETVRCGLKGAGEHPRALPTHTLALYMQYCEAKTTFPPNPERALSLARRVVAETPDFSRGWSAVAYGVSQRWFRARTPAEKAANARELGDATGRALKLDRRNGEAYELQTYILPPTQLMEAERLHRLAAEASLSGCGCELVTMGNHLARVGRLREAADYYRRAYDLQPLYPPAVLSLAASYDGAGRREEADAMIARLRAVWGDEFAGFLARHAALWDDWPAARRIVQTRSPPEDRPALGAAIDAMQSGDPARIAAARAGVEAVVRRRRGPGQIWMLELLIQMDAPDEPFRQFDPLIAAGGSDVLFDRIARRLRHDPRYAAALEKGGLFDYWRKSKTKPDLCGDPEPPAFCRTL